MEDVNLSDDIDEQGIADTDSLRRVQNDFNKDFIPLDSGERNSDQKRLEALTNNEVKKLARTVECPNCKNLGCKIIEKKSIWQRLYYWGTTLAECKKCRTRFPI